MSFAFSPEIGYWPSFDGDVVIQPRLQCVPGEHEAWWHVLQRVDVGVIDVAVDVAGEDIDVCVDEGDEYQQQEGGVLQVAVMADPGVALLSPRITALLLSLNPAYNINFCITLHE